MCLLGQLRQSLCLTVLVTVLAASPLAKAQGVVNSEPIQLSRRTNTPSFFFTAATRSAGPSDSFPAAWQGRDSNPVLSISSAVLCAGEDTAEKVLLCGQTSPPASRDARPRLLSRYLYLYTVTFAAPWTSALTLEIDAPFDPALSREFGQVTYGVLQDLDLASNPSALIQTFPPSPCASVSPGALSDCIDGLVATSASASSSPLRFTLQPGAAMFLPGDTIVLFATSFYPPTGCVFPAGNIQDCSDSAVITLKDSNGTLLGQEVVLGPSISSPPIPVISALQPDTAAAGTADPLVLTLIGPAPAGTSLLDSLNFVQGAQVLWNDSLLPSPPRFQGTTQLTVQVPPSYLTAAGSVNIVVRNPRLNLTDPGQVSSPVQFITSGTNPLPTISALSPSSVTAGSPAFPLTVTGTNFVNGAMVQVGGAPPLATTFNSPTSVTATIPAADVVHTGSILISVINPMPGGGTSNALPLQVLPAALPTLTAISPTTAIAGSTSLTLSVTGTNFTATAAVQVNGSPVPTVFNSDSSLTAVLPASAIAAAGTLAITVLSPAPGGATSNALSLQVINPVPALASLSPSSVLAGSAGANLTVIGMNFVNGASVQVNATSLAPSSVTATSLTVTIPANLLAAAGSLSITVTNPAPGGGTSNALSLAVLNPVPVLTSLSQTSVLVGSAGFNLVVMGTSFVNGATVQVNTTALTPASGSATSLTVALPASFLASVGPLSISVVNPAPGGGSSNILILQVASTNPVPTLTSFSPAAVIAGSPALSLVLAGANFTNSATVQVNGATVPTTFNSSLSLTATIPANNLAAAAMLSITVFNPAPGGGASSALILAVTDFSISSTSGTQTVTAGQTANFTVVLGTQGGPLPGMVTFTCSGLPGAANFSFNPASLPAGAVSSTSALMITTTARSSLPGSRFAPPRMILPGFLRLAAGGFAALLLLKRRALTRWPILPAAALAAVLLAACGGGGSGTSSSSSSGTPKGTPPGTYMITVMASSGAATRTTTVTLQVN